MALSAAERQKRARENKKAKLVQIESATARAIVERELVEENARTYFDGTPTDAKVTIEDYLLHLAGYGSDDFDVKDSLESLHDSVMGSFVQSIREAFPLTDPWPELTAARLRDMIGTDEKRRRKAQDNGLWDAFRYHAPEDGSAPRPLRVELKIWAHRNREWLEEPEKKAARKAQRAENGAKRRAAKAEKDQVKAVATYSEKAEGFGRF